MASAPTSRNIASRAAAKTDDVENTSVYAGRNDRGNVVLMAINKTARALPVTIKLRNCPTGKGVEVWRLTKASASPVADKALAVSRGQIVADLPAQSITTMVVAPAAKK